MLSKEELIKLLAEEYGIHNGRELDEALERTAVNYAVFTERPPMMSEAYNGQTDVQKVS